MVLNRERARELARSAFGGPRCSDDQGLVLYLVVALVVVICIAAALVVDFGNARQTARQDQASTDAAALAAARKLPLSAQTASNPTSGDAARTEAMTFLVRNLFPTSPPSVPSCPTGQTTCTATVQGKQLTVTTPYTMAGSSIAPYNLVYVKACVPTPTFFARVAGQDSPTVCRDAVARRQNASGGFNMGLVSTNPTRCAALTFAGDSDTILSSNGAVMVNSSCNSTNTGALDASGSSWSLQSNFIGVVGSATLAPCDPATQTTQCTQTVPTPISSFPDPFGSLPEPTRPAGPAMSCPGSGGAALTPGLYDDCKITNGDVTLAPGLYYFEDGFEMSGGNLVCSDGGSGACTTTGILLFVKTGTLKINGNGRVYLPPYQVAPYTGMSLWQSRTNTNEATINGTSDFSMGSVYVAGANLKANGNGGSSSQINITGIVVTDTISITGNFYFNINVPIDSPIAPTADDIGLEL